MHQIILEGMKVQRNVASDKYEDVSKALADKYKKGEISKDVYHDAKINLRKGLTSKRDVI